jgi:hypothetical protein
MRWASSIRNWKHSLERRWALHQALRRPAACRRVVRPRLEVLEDRWLLSTYSVTSAGDSGAGTLRDAITQANATGSTITEIDFNIGTSGSAQTIDLLSHLPTLTASGVFINGLSQEGSGNTSPLIELNGSGAGSGSDGLLLTGANCIVSGLIIENFTNNGIEIDGSDNTIGGTTSGARNVISGNSSDGVRIDSGVSGVLVQGNYIGTNVTGTTALPNDVGISADSPNNTIGGTATGAGNLISGNKLDGVGIGASGVTVQGNYIGTDATGAKAVPNYIGIEVNSGIASGSVIGGTSTAAPNIISGNSNYGVVIDSGVSGVQVQGNYIGTDVTGAKAVANFGGILIEGGSNDTIGGTATGARNIISGSTDYGVDIINSVSGVQVQGNYIGTDVTGANALANSIGVECVASNNNTIGGTATGAGNTISGNSYDGVDIYLASGVLVQGNDIGTDATGAKALGNSWGVIDNSANNNTIGGTTTGAGNVISGNSNDGIYVSNASGVLMQGNDIGTDATGANAVANNYGVIVESSNNTVGGTVSGARNVISGNSIMGVWISGVSGNIVQGNYIGTDVTGAKAVGNSIGVEVFSSNNTIGGTTTAARNVISGNIGSGVIVDADTVQVQGNFIGTDATGTKAVANSVGVEVLLITSHNTIGGTAAGAGNIISGNSHDGVLIYSGRAGVTVQGNHIGTDVTGAKAVANSVGVEVGGSKNTIGGLSTTMSPACRCRATILAPQPPPTLRLPTVSASRWPAATTPSAALAAAQAMLSPLIVRTACVSTAVSPVWRSRAITSAPMSRAPTRWATAATAST